MSLGICHTTRLNVSQGWIPTYHSRSHSWLFRKKWLSSLNYCCKHQGGHFFFPLWVGVGGTWAPGNRPVNFVFNLLKGYWPCFESPVIMITWLWWHHPNPHHLNQSLFWIYSTFHQNLKMKSNCLSLEFLTYAYATSWKTQVIYNDKKCSIEICYIYWKKCSVSWIVCVST